MTEFQKFTYQGILANEPVRGMRMNIHDALIHTDPAHYGAG